MSVQCFFFYCWAFGKGSMYVCVCSKLLATAVKALCHDLCGVSTAYLQVVWCRLSAKRCWIWRKRLVCIFRHKGRMKLGLLRNEKLFFFVFFLSGFSNNDFFNFWNQTKNISESKPQGNWNFLTFMYKKALFQNQNDMQLVFFFLRKSHSPKNSPTTNMKLIFVKLCSKGKKCPWSQIQGIFFDILWRRAVRSLTFLCFC